MNTNTYITTALIEWANRCDGNRQAVLSMRDPWDVMTVGLCIDWRQHDLAFGDVYEIMRETQHDLLRMAVTS